MRRGVGRPAEAVARIVANHGVSVAEAREIVVDYARTQGAVAVSPFEDQRRDVKGAEILDAWFGFGSADESHVHMPVLLGEHDEPDGWSLGVVTILGPRLELDLLKLDDYAATVLGASREPAAPMPAERNRGGRPPVHDWERAQAQVLARVWNYGLPRSQDELSAELMEWFARNSRTPPDLRTIERRLAEWWPLLRQVAVVECELGPADRGDETR